MKKGSKVIGNILHLFKIDFKSRKVTRQQYGVVSQTTAMIYIDCEECSSIRKSTLGVILNKDNSVFIWSDSPITPDEESKMIKYSWNVISNEMKRVLESENLLKSLSLSSNKQNK